MDRAAPALPPPDDRGPLAAFAALVLLPIALLALAGTLPGPAASPASVAPVETAEPMPDLPASPEDTVVLSELTATDARARNAAVEFAAVGPGTPSPFRFDGSAADRLRARDCLALAGMAEAGGGDGDRDAL